RRTLFVLGVYSSTRRHGPRRASKKQSNSRTPQFPVSVFTSRFEQQKEAQPMNVHLINPSTVSFGTAVITPRWQYVLAGATPKTFGDPILVDENLFQIDPARIQPGDAVGIGIHTANALRGYEIGKLARERGAYVIFGGIHATLYPNEAHELGTAHAVVKGDGDVVWATVLADCCYGAPQKVYGGGRITDSVFLP